MLKRSQLAIIKDGVLTLNGYTFSMVYKLLGICSNPGTYTLDKNKGTKWKSDGVNVWLIVDRGIFVIGSVITKFELIKALNDLLICIDSATRYYDIEGTLFREYSGRLYYLEPIPSSSVEVTYKEDSIPMSIVFKVLRADFPITSKNFSYIYMGRLAAIKEVDITNEYIDNNLQQLGYTKIEDYYALITFDEVVRIDTIEDNRLKSFTTNLSSLKEVIIV